MADKDSSQENLEASQKALDASQEALDQVEKLTESDRAKGEDLLGSEDLKRQLRDAKQRLEREKSPPTDDH